MTHIPTAETILARDYASTKENAISAMVEFAKLHVKAALEFAAKRAIDLHHNEAELDNNCNDYEEAAEKYITDSYPETLIK